MQQPPPRKSLKAIKATIVSIALLTLVGCGVISAVIDWFQDNCAFTGGGISCSLGMTYAQQQRAANFTSAELAAFSASQFQIDISQGNATLDSFGGSAHVTLLSGTNPIASTQVPMQITNGVITVSNPGAIEAWIQTHGINANGFDVQLDDLEFNVNPGSNTVHTLVNYGSDNIANRSFAHWVNPNEPICCEQIK